MFQTHSKVKIAPNTNLSFDADRIVHKENGIFDNHKKMELCFGKESLNMRRYR
jgi:hypothetical protein